jgi:DNA mismatch repair protein MutL
MFSLEAGARAGAQTVLATRAADDGPAALTDAVIPCACAEGTTVEVRNLFFNVPVRRKFLKSTQTEIGHISEAVVRLALAQPRVHFTLRHNGREIYDLPPTADWRERILRFFGQELADGLIAIEREAAADGAASRCRLFGYVADPAHSRPNNRSQYFFLNGRYIRDRSLQHALSEAYRGLLLTGRFPIAFIGFELAAEDVDVNVHPTKLEVRFQDGGRLYSLLLGTLRTKFLSTDLTAHWKPPGVPGESGDTYSSAAAHDVHRAEGVRQELVAWAKGQMAGWEADDAANAKEAFVPASGGRQPSGAADALASPDPLQFAPQPLAPDDDLAATRPTLKLHKLEGPLSAFTAAAPNDQGPALFGGQALDGAAAEESYPGADSPAGLRPPLEGSSAAMQVHNRYLIAETGEGVLVIDQHALHERILYEQLRAKVLAGSLECQSLLVPQPVDLSPAEAASVLEQRELLAQLGLRVEPFGGDTVLVTSYPAMLAKVNSLDMLRGIVERLLGGGQAPQRRDLLDELLHMMACKAAVKAGDRLAPEEVDALLQQRHLAQDTHHCPHGRPTALVLTREELDRQFLRT